ncbi:MAG: hypothetical protein M3R69_00800, partial [Acidobacteriota bacterium]|nr:hypothetical protein [Acidobacteriota bacterium]
SEAGILETTVTEEVRKMTLSQGSKKEQKSQRSSILLTSLAGRMRHRMTMALLLIIVATTTAGSSCSELRNEDSRNKASLDAPLDFCDLVRKPDDYDSKKIRLRSVITGFHELAFYSAGCDSKIKYMRADMDSKVRNQFVERVASLSGSGMQHGNFWVDVVVNGRFEKIPDSDCTKQVTESGIPNRYHPNYCYRIAVESVESVEPVPTTIAWPN